MVNIRNLNTLTLGEVNIVSIILYFFIPIVRVFEKKKIERYNRVKTYLCIFSFSSYPFYN